ncbi:hypothetical protein BDB01DRAFT_844564 [Pilobolus umbonatus]|nr:hypothetical protein BDB01DRAFT_844564 [Pilobolus umbonatus]
MNSFICFGNRVPTCPICDKPVPVKRGHDPNIRMNDHIQSGCADLEVKKDNICCKKGCVTKLLVPMKCSDCGLNFCVKHRLEIDHECQGKPMKNTMNKQNNRIEMERQRLDRLQTMNRRKQDIALLQSKAKQGTITDNEQIELAKLLSMKTDKKCCIS